MKHRNITWGELQSLVLNRIWKGTKSELTASINLESVVSFFGKNNVVPHELSVRSLDEFIHHLEAKGNSNATINRKLNALSKTLKFALEREYITKIPRIERKKESTGRIRWLTDDEEKKLVAHFISVGRQDVATLCLFLLDTGARVGEALKVEWKDFQNNKVTFWNTKNDTSRSIPLTSRLLSCLSSPQYKGPFCHIDYNEFHYLWRKAKEALGLAQDEEFVPHCLRHTCASRLVQSGVPILTAKEFLGHKSVNITMRYAHLAPQNLTDAVKVLER